MVPLAPTSCRQPDLGSAGPCVRWRRALHATLATVLVSPLLADDVVVNEIMYHPASNLASEEYVELFNRGTNTYNLEGWRFSAGVDFVFPRVLMEPGGYLVVAANTAAFTNRYADVTNYVGGWQGRLGDNGEKLTLRDAYGQEVDSVAYATEGDWGTRTRGPVDYGHQGWVWRADHAGGGSSLELANPLLPNRYGQNWAASVTTNGTPGRANSVLSSNRPPMVLEVAHQPATPRSDQAVTVTARLIDEVSVGLQVVLHHRVDGVAEFSTTPMLDDGQHGDGGAGDLVFGAVLPPQPQDTVVEFYVEARDRDGLTRTWPGPVQPSGAQEANCLYQVDDRAYDGRQPLLRVVMTEAERKELEEMDGQLWYWSSNAQMNGTFIGLDGGETELRYNVGFRLRGTTSRAGVVKSRRVNFRDDELWEGERAINLNANHPYCQIMGSALARRAGLPAAKVRAVQLRQNNRQLASTNVSPFGVYAQVEVLNSEFARSQFPLDSSGNLYHAIGGGNLDYLGELPESYREPTRYRKRNNTAEDDWTDLIRLTRVLNTTSPDRWYAELQQVADVSEWVSYFAVNTVLANAESGLGTGGPGDYALYDGVADPRFRLLIYDLDSVLGVEGGVETPLLRATNNPAIRRFLTAPEVAPQYYRELNRLVDGPLRSDAVNALIDELLGDWVPPGAIQFLKDSHVSRIAFIRSHIPAGLTVATTQSSYLWQWVSSNGVANVYGQANPEVTRQVLVNGQPAVWDPLTGGWSAYATNLLPGVNSLLVQAVAEDGSVVQESSISIWYNTGRMQEVGGLLSQDTIWTPEAGPYHATNDLVVPAGTTLTILPGTTVFYEQNRQMLVQGRLLAEGAPYARIHMSRVPGAVWRWSGLRFDGSPDSRLAYLDMVYNNATAIGLTNSALTLGSVKWLETDRNLLWATQSSLAVRHCVFPRLNYDEHVRGDGIPAAGQMVFEDNVFGATSGYCDVVDIAGGHRPGPIIEVRRNVFLGGGDDGVDLDGNDAHIEDNVFMHFHKSNDSTSESSAISCGGYYPETGRMVIARNVFYDNDNDIVAKEKAVVECYNNTHVAAIKGAISIKEPGRPYEDPPKEVRVQGDIFRNNPVIFANLDTNWLASGATRLIVENSLVDGPGPWTGTGNVTGDPRFVNSTNDFHLRPGSPALGSGPNGLDMGAYVAGGPSFGGEPSAVTWQREAHIRIDGPGLDQIRWRLNEGAWSEAIPPGTVVALSNLTDGAYQLFAIGMDSAGLWQSSDAASASRPWTVRAGATGLRLSEILCRSTTTGQSGGTDAYVELFNDSPNELDLGGLSLSDSETNPTRFVLPAGTKMAPQTYLTVALGGAGGAGSLQTGFGLDRDGDALFLFNRPEAGGGVLDSVRFGLQISDRSLGRNAAGDWVLGLPTPGLANVAVRLGDPNRVRINEWLARPGTAGTDDFVELFNSDPLPVSLAGLYLTDEPFGHPFQHALGPFSFLAGKGFAAFQADGTTSLRANHLKFRLAGEQGVIGLVDHAGALVDWVTYGAQVPGSSEGREPAGAEHFTNLPAPTPGYDSSSLAAMGDVVLSEVCANGLVQNDSYAGGADWVELRNLTTNWVSLAGLGLSDNPLEPRWTFAAETVLPPLDYLVVVCDPDTPPSATNTGFGLSAEGDAVVLFDRSEQGSLILDQVGFGFQPVGYSLARGASGTNGWALCHPTPKAANLPVALGSASTIRINEWMASPEQGEDWFELFNRDAKPVSLAGLRLTDSGQSPEYVFAEYSFMGPSPAYLLLLADDKTTRGAHAPFKLSGQGDSLFLRDGEGTALDQVQFGAQTRSVSQGRYPDGTEVIRDLSMGGSPGAPNTLNEAPVLVAIADQTLVAGQAWSLQLQAVDPDGQTQTLTFSLVPPTPDGLTLNPTTGALSWTPTREQAMQAYRVTARVADNGQPPQSDDQSFTLVVQPVEGGPVVQAVFVPDFGLTLAWEAPYAGRYAIEYRDDLGQGAWLLMSEATVQAGAAQVSLPVGSERQRFFRLRWVP